MAQLPQAQGDGSALCSSPSKDRERSEKPKLQQHTHDNSFFFRRILYQKSDRYVIVANGILTCFREKEQDAILLRSLTKKI